MLLMKKLSIAIVSVLVAAFLTVSAGCELLPITRSAATTSQPATSVSPIKPGFTISTPSGATSTPLPSIADVVARVKPSVVAINVEVVTTNIFGQRITEEGAGSGWIIDPNGIIVTNNHVVQDATKVTVQLEDGTTYDANPANIATDPLADLAVIKIDATDLPAASVGDSNALRVGDWVVAIGNSLGQGIRATVGIVSQQSVSVDVDGQTLTGLIETDAAINPGNSGGPLVNTAGEVIGINSVKIAQVGVEGVGYAIGTEEAAPLIQQLVNAGYVTRPFLGVAMDYIDVFNSTRYGLAVGEGALIVQVVPGSPAEAAGLQPGDVITRFGGQDITTPDELRQAIHQNRIGESVDITYWRGDTQASTSATLIASPAQ
jgi:serine protease Do